MHTPLARISGPLLSPVAPRKNAIALLAWIGLCLIVVAEPVAAQDEQAPEPAATIAVGGEQVEFQQATDGAAQVGGEKIVEAVSKVKNVPQPVEASANLEGNAEAVEVDHEHDPGLAQDPQVLKLRRYVRVNCGLARRVCELSGSEEEAFSRMNDAWIENQIRESVELPGVGEMVGILRFLGGAARDDRPQEVKLPAVKKRIDLAIDQALTPEHREAFHRERDERDRFRKHALAGVLVAVLDDRLFLSPEQRGQLEPAIAAWLTTDLYWEFYFQNSSYLPDIPRQVLAEALTLEQLAILHAAQKYNLERAQFEDQMAAEPVMIER